MHHNPDKRGFVNSPELWPWSSYRAYAFGERGPVNMDWMFPPYLMKKTRVRRFGQPDEDDPVIIQHTDPLKTEAVTKLRLELSVWIRSGFMSIPFWDRRISSGCQSRTQSHSTQHFQHAFDVKDHYRQSDLGLCSPQPAQQEAGMAEDVIFDRGKRMFHQRSA
jgi:hypothetical protein